MAEPQHQRQRSQDGGGIPRPSVSSTERHHRRNGSTPSSRQSITLSQLERQWSVGNVYDSFGTAATDEFVHAWASASNLAGGEPFHVDVANPTPSFHASIGPMSSTAIAAATAVTSAVATEQLWLERAASPVENEVSSIIHDEARVVAWNTVLELCRNHPRHAKYAGPDGWTALHHACNRRCNRQDVVEALVKAYPAALMDLEEKGMTPLHYACRFKAPKDTVRILLNLYPDMGHLAVSKRDKIGRTPLWYAVRYDAPTGVVDMLLDIESSVILEEDKAGESPLSLVWDIWAEKFEGKKTLAPFLEPAANTAEGTTAFATKKMFPEERKAQFFALLEVQNKLRARWETTNLFLKANFGLSNATNTDRTYRMLHATVSIPCHPTLFLLAKTLYPEQASELEESDLLPQGGKQTALHLAAASVASGEAAKTVVTALLDLNPAAVQVVDSAQGSLPLHIFVERKYHWVHDGIRDVYQAYPAALQQGDATGRLPLHRAAQANQHGGGPGGSMILELMEAWPQAAAQPDQSGRLALHYVAEYGETWEDESEAIYRGHEAAVRTRAGPSARLPLHMAAASPDARRSLLEMLVELHPRGAMQAERTGKLPLHLACESGKLWDKGVGAIYEAYEAAIREPEQNPRRWMALQMAAASPNTSADVIQQLASRYPEAAAQVDADGRCALHWACESGKEWNSGLKYILHANPMANICEDNAGKLPFHIAALKQCRSNNENVTSGVLMTDNQTPHTFQTRSRSCSVVAETEPNADDVDAEASKIEILYQLLMVDPNILPKYL